MSANLDPAINEQTFPVGNVDGFATITLRRIRAKDKVRVGVRQSVYLDGLDSKTMNLETQEFSYILSLLEVALVEPKNFPFERLEDEDLVALWKEWDTWNKSFRLNRDGAVQSTGGRVPADGGLPVQEAV